MLHETLEVLPQVLMRHLNIGLEVDAKRGRTYFRHNVNDSYLVVLLDNLLQSFSSQYIMIRD